MRDCPSLGLRNDCGSAPSCRALLYENRYGAPARRAPWPCTQLYVSPEYSREYHAGQVDCAFLTPGGPRRAALWRWIAQPSPQAAPLSRTTARTAPRAAARSVRAGSRSAAHGWQSTSAAAPRRLHRATVPSARARGCTGREGYGPHRAHRRFPRSCPRQSSAPRLPAPRPYRGHVLAAMVAHALNDRAGSAVAHGKALSRPPRGKQPAAGGAIEDGIAEDDVPIGHAHQRPGRPDHDDAARHPFADIIVGFPLQHQGYARHTEGTEALPGGTGELKGDRSIREAGVPVRFSDHARHPGPDRAVGVADGRTQPDRPSLRSRRGDLANDLRVEGGVLGPVVAWGHVPAGPCPLRIGVAQDELEIHTRRFGVVSRLWPEQIHAADDFLNRPGAELGQDLTDLGGHGAQVGDDHLGRAAELRAQRLLLGGNAHRARIEVTLPGHHAPQRHDGGAAEAVLIRAQQGGDDDIATDLQSAINAEPHAPPQVVAPQHLLRLGQA